ncbi:putative transcriptional regulator [Staphylococcus piscifermentans]|uniref:TetR family transcriptional regulator n=1 Tax=Staphylococcus piscifermentans TaxID=70258 RepID=A0A239TP39_9STAP|nr:TetR/AcrR family transcriptional regulator [Staphylococcus piscifermentans]RTX85954.1 TetR/AcrR family transcriptional regulator [Staphylococcus piscifermentans]GEP85611.1 TetR family transcriptional regulator [Staphylococcus piscifermentans]SNU99661.1 putative transcriptional regulator [Staphylococcus piscifermentans]
MKKNAKRKIFVNTIDLMEEYPIDEITIKMICAYSGINRSTFYAHFTDKYDLFEQIQAYHISRNLQITNTLYQNFDQVKYNKAKLLQFFRIQFKYIYRYRRFFHAVFISHPQKDFVIEMVHLTYESYEKVMAKYTDMDYHMYYIQYLIGGQLGVVFSWLRRNCEESPEEMARIMLRNTIKMRELEETDLPS